MRKQWIIGLVFAAAATQAVAGPAAVATCLIVYIAVGKQLGTYDSYIQVPCAVATANSLKFEAGGGGSPTAGMPVTPGSWIANLPANETGAVYLSDSELGADYRGLLRNVKPYVAGTAYFGTLFAESLGSYQSAAISRNESVDTNLARVRGAAISTQVDLSQAKAARDAGLPAVASQQAVQLAGNLKANQAGVGLATGAANDIADRLSKLPQSPAPSELTSLGARDKLPSNITNEVLKVVDNKRLVGSVSLVGKTAAGQGIANAADLELAQYDQLDPVTRGSARLKQGAEALKQAKYFAAQNPELAAVLYAEGRSARAFATGQSKVEEVAAWNAASGKFVMSPIDDAVIRALPLAALVGDQTSIIRQKISSAAGGIKQRPPDSALRATEQIVAQAEAELESDPVKSLGGLFRARTVLENLELYGGAWVKLTLWTRGAAKRLKEAFSPPKTFKDPGAAGKYIAIEISKKLKSSLSSYRKSIESGEYAMLGIDKVQDIFGSDALTEMKKSLQDASEAADQEAQPLTGLEAIAPTVDLLLLPEARQANEENTKEEIAELTKLRDLYSDRQGDLKVYQQRLLALSSLANLYASELSSPAWATVASMKCLSTVCAAEVIALSDQLSEVGSSAQDASRQTQKAIERYQSEIKKIDQLLDAWLQVLPDPSVRGYRPFGAPMRDLGTQFPK